MRRSLTWCAALVMGCLAGCGGPGGQAPPARLYPFGSAVYLTQRESTVLHAAEERAVQQCMRERGFAYRPDSGSVPDEEPDNPYGLLSEAQARTDGYGITPRLVATTPASTSTPAPVPHAQPASPRTRPWDRALLGTVRRTLTLPGGEQVVIATDACVTEARRRVYGPDWDRLFYTVQALSNQVVTQTQAHPAFRARQAAWARCMAEAGVAGSTLNQVRDRVEDSLTRAVARTRREPAAREAVVSEAARTELRTAGTDARCQREVGLRDAVATAQAEVERRVLAGHAADLAKLRTLRQQALARATAGAPGGGST